MTHMEAGGLMEAWRGSGQERGGGLWVGWEGGWLPVLVCVAGVSHQVVVNVRLKDEFTLVTDVSLMT